MQRAICGYSIDERGDWIATLDCHHGQHVRHNPPFTNRPWVETEAGRSKKLGMLLDCVRCDRFEFPQDLTFQRRTPVFDQTSVPKGLLSDHSTKTGTWGRICVHEGQLRYTAGEHQEILSPDRQGIVVPNMLHSVQTIGNVQFCVEFFTLEER